jgi:hypothetical protein
MVFCHHIRLGGQGYGGNSKLRAKSEIVVGELPESTSFILTFVTLFIKIVSRSINNSRIIIYVA